MRLALLLFFVCLTITLFSQAVITEILYNAGSSESTTQTQFIEIANTSGSPLDVSGWSLDDEDADGPNTFPAGTIIPPFGILVVVGSTAEDFATHWGLDPGVQILSLEDDGQTMINLSNSPSATSEIIQLRNSIETLIDEVNFDDAGDWPGDNGTGSIYLNLSNADIISTGTVLNDIGTNWSIAPASEEVSTDAGPWDGTDAGSPGTVNSSAFLPVTLTNLAAERRGKTAMVKWATATESGNSHFVVERSQDGRLFTEVGRINGAGDSYGIINYDFTDVAPTNGDNYYRLRQVDLTGAETVFGPVMVSFEGEGLTAFPNPVANRLFVSGATATSRTTILDLNGRVMATDLTTGDGIETNNLAPGTYLLRVESAEGTETLRFVKQ